MYVVIYRSIFNENVWFQLSSRFIDTRAVCTLESYVRNCRWKEKERRRSSRNWYTRGGRTYVWNLNHIPREKLEILSRLQVGRVTNTVVLRALTIIVIYLSYPRPGGSRIEKKSLCTFLRFPCQIVCSIVIVFSVMTILDRLDTFVAGQRWKSRKYQDFRYQPH